MNHNCYSCATPQGLNMVNGRSHGDRYGRYTPTARILAVVLSIILLDLGPMGLPEVSQSAH